jgi:hypothetical protein
MLGLSDARHFRRLVAGFCLIVAPVALLVGAIVQPQGEEDAAAHISMVGEDPARYYAARAILLVGLALFLPAILGRRAPAAGACSSLPPCRRWSRHDRHPRGDRDRRRGRDGRLAGGATGSERRAGDRD